MTRQEVLALARLGMIARLKGAEHDLAAAHKLFPDLFLSPTAPQLLRPELRNGHVNPWPALVDETAPRPKGKTKNGKTLGRPKKLRHTDKIRAQREASAAILDHIEQAKHPVTHEQVVAAGFNPRALGSLARRKYVRKTKRGYIRLPKAFSIEKGQGAEA